jgi:phosphoribosyl-ATP pyrophosphohydrolase/phosphoribosyl-AMP cyclohydrolase
MRPYFFENLAWDKMQGLIPAIVQDADTGKVLMLAYMSQEALQKTCETQWVTFFSRSKNNLWVKGEISGNRLALVEIIADCDADTLLVLARPQGPACHTGDVTCFGNAPKTDAEFMRDLSALIAQRDEQRPEGSYTTELFQAGLKRIAQKVGEEAVEVALAAVKGSDEETCEEAADLLFHLLVLLRARKLCLADVVKALRARA